MFLKDESMEKRVLLTGGGTGGHIFPLVAVAQKLKKEVTEKTILKMIYMGADAPGSDALKREEVTIKIILTGKIRRYAGFFSILDNFIDLFKISLGIIQTAWHLWNIMPDVIFSKGGYGAFSTVVVGWFYRIPVVIHESDAIPGITNRITGKLAKNIAISFNRAGSYFNEKKVALTGNPIRESLLTGDKEEAKNIFQLSGDRPVLLILGGSQGSQPINLFILNILRKLLENFEIIHQCGENNYSDFNAKISSLLSKEELKFYHLYPFLGEELKYAYAAGDLIISRASAGSIFEIAAVGKASILIPLPDSAGNHQRFNAFDYAKVGATIVLDQENLTENMLLEKVKYLITNDDLRHKMEERARGFARLDAAENIAKKILEIINHNDEKK